MSHEITIAGGKSKKLLTGGKFCEQDIIIRAEGGGSGGQINLQSNKTVVPTTSRKTILPDSGYDAMEKVTVEAMPQANLAAPSISVSSGGLITARSTQTTSGYVASGATAQATSQLSTQAGKTITPSKSSQTAVSSGKYTTGAVMVAPIPDSYVQPSGTLPITENGYHDVKSYAAVNVNVTSSGGSEAEEQFIRFIERNTSNPVTALPAGVTKIGDYAFDGDNLLALTSLPDGVTNVGKYAFRNCTNLALTSLPSALTQIGNYAFYSCMNNAFTSLPAGLTVIPSNAFYSNNYIVITSLPSGLTEIGPYAFRGCNRVTITSFPASLKNLSNYAFQNCYGLTEITFEGKPDFIAFGAFDGCKNLLTINVPWAEGEVGDAPWSATNATINYNYTGG